MGDIKGEVELINSSTTYISEVLKIKNSMQQPETKLELLTILVKDYFRKKYHVSKNLGFSELIEFFIEKRKPTLATYCHDMVTDLYSGEEINETKINSILENTKIMLTKDLSTKEHIEDKISVKEVINPFSALQDAPISKDRILSKNARKLIERYLKDQESEKMEISNTQEKQVQINEEENLDYLKKKLSLNQNQVTDESLYVKGDDPEKIEGIDSFERLKDKIKKRKI